MTRRQICASAHEYSESSSASTFAHSSYSCAGSGLFGGWWDEVGGHRKDRRTRRTRIRVADFGLCSWAIDLIAGCRGSTSEQVAIMHHTKLSFVAVSAWSLSCSCQTLLHSEHKCTQALALARIARFVQALALLSSAICRSCKRRKGRGRHVERGSLAGDVSHVGSASDG